MRHPQDQSWSDSGEAFYIWLYERPSSPWGWVGGLALVLLGLAVPLLPVAPYPVRYGRARGREGEGAPCSPACEVLGSRPAVDRARVSTLHAPAS